MFEKGEVCAEARHLKIYGGKGPWGEGERGHLGMRVLVGVCYDNYVFI